ncbi:AzlD domain-containing protein [Pseudactinotalea terrae]|uniref:AzlD domain-containing protein n=1 Tax=Pseudactinotalea terrae TaxID=1743262 RepID=UPI0012E2EF64|nr:AzlD domain-containing protein [Pseudactinotalea terrae]
MSLWLWVLIAALVCVALKLVGYLVPTEVLENRRMAHTAAMVTCALLAALVVTQTFAEGTALVIDARLVAVAVAAGALWLRAPFIVVVILGAAAAAAVRALGWG